MALEKELETYTRELPQLGEHEGKFVLIHQDEVVDVFQAYEDALKEGYDRFGLDPFLVKQIQAIERVQYFSRDVAPTCRT